MSFSGEVSRSTLALLALVFLAFALGAQEPASEKNGLESEADPREAELERIRGEIARLEARLGDLRSREAGLEAELERTEVELELQENRLREATTAFELAERAVEELEIEVGEIEAALEAVLEDLQRRLGGLYRLGHHGYLRLFLSLESDQELLPAVRQLRFLVRRDRETLDRYTALRGRLDERGELLVAERAAMEEWRAQEAQRRDELAGLRRRQRRLLERVSRERQEVAERALELREKARKLELLIDSLVREELDPLEGAAMGDFKGILDWPSKGEVSVHFGPRRDPRYRTEVPHNGISLTTEEGTRVGVVYPGQVLFADNFEGYGPMVVVHHPGRIFTLYAGLAELRVAKGDVLSLGTAVGLAADELYFEIRRENQPEDPLEWLR